MENTFTYTARSALVPEKVVTFTLYDHHMSVDLGAPLEHIERGVAKLQEERAAEPEDREEAEPLYAAKPTAVSLFEKVVRPFDIADVTVRADNGGLTVAAWVRARGLRLAPIRFALERVDNPQGAEVFANEVQARKRDAPHPGRFRGVMDYWIGWLLLGALVISLLWPRRAQQDREEA